MQTNTLSAQDTIRFEVSDTLKSLKHSPTRAAILSAVFPGMGQIYNKKYWKVPILYAGLVTTAYFILHFNNLYTDYLNGYINYSKYKDINAIQHLKKINFNYPDINVQLVFYKDIYRRYRDLDVLIFGGIYLLNIIDATVDAYFFNYDISDDLSMRVQPTYIQGQVNQGAFGIRLCFSIH